MFASTSAKEDRGDTKDSVAQIRDTGVFAVNVVEYAMRDVMNMSSGTMGQAIDEFDKAGIEKATATRSTVPALPAPRPRWNAS